MNSLERAKRFLAQKASRLALAVLPLAAVALSTPTAKASAILSSGPCFVTPGFGSCDSSTATGGGNTGLNTIDVSSTSGSAASFFDNLTFTAFGSADGGSVSGQVPVSWDFVLQNLDLDPTVSWTVTFKLANGIWPNNQFYTFTQSGSNATSVGGTVVSGSGFINIPSGGGNDITGWFISLQSNSPFSLVTNNNYGIDIPGNATLELNSPGGGAVPEPSTLLLMLPGVAGAMLLRRKRRA